MPQRIEDANNVIDFVDANGVQCFLDANNNYTCDQAGTGSDLNIGIPLHSHGITVRRVSRGY